MKSVPEDIIDDYRNILVVASATNGPREMTEAEMYKAVDWLDKQVRGFAKKHLSDSPSKMDRQRMAIEVFELALKLAKGEVKWQP